MKVGVITQRIDIIASYDEIRDALDEQWHVLFSQMNANLIPLPNHPQSLSEILERVEPDFIVLSGGNTPESYGGSAPQRDETDRELIAYSLRNRIPLLGVCRGMQSVALYWDSTLKKIEGHIATNHKICWEGDIFKQNGRNTNNLPYSVNSFHAYAIDRLGDGLEAIARTEDADYNIEAIRGRMPYQDLIHGIMWHPERVKGFDKKDIEMIREWLKL